jgi:chemotaxis protein methyltransferase CheR
MEQTSVWRTQREGPMSESCYRDLCQLIHRHSRIHLGPGKLTLLTGRLAKHRHQLRLPSWEDYVHFLQSAPTQDIDILIDLVSTNHTYFFREATHFDILTSQLLGPLLEQVPSAHDGLKCWSAGCASGEEAFTLAIALHEYALRHKPNLRWQIEATDISHRVLLKAQNAVYDMAHVGLPDADFLPRYFQKGTGPYEGFCQVKKTLRDRVSFRQLNLFGQPHKLPSRQHVVFCRKVLIYFEDESQTQLVRQMHELIEPGGFLIVGHSESLQRIAHPFKSLGNGIYQREFSV